MIKYLDLTINYRSKQNTIFDYQFKTYSMHKQKHLILFQVTLNGMDQFY